MARKLDSEPGLGHSTDPARLRILDWDEGAPQANGWADVNITYRQERPGFESDQQRPFPRIVIDPADSMPKRE